MRRAHWYRRHWIMLCAVALLAALWLQSVCVGIHYQFKFGPVTHDHKTGRVMMRWEGGWCSTGGLLAFGYDVLFGDPSGQPIPVNELVFRPPFPTVFPMPFVGTWYGGTAIEVPYWLLIVLTIVGARASVWIRQAWRTRRTRRGCCRKCGYDLRMNLSGTCPECGTAISESPRTG